MADPGSRTPATRQTINALVMHFYAAIRRDSRLGPIFDRAIGDAWDLHLDKMVDFWSSVMFKTGEFKGQPMIVHQALAELRREHFPLWLDLFRHSANTICPPDFAAEIIDRAERIAVSLQRGVFSGPGQFEDEERTA